MSPRFAGTQQQPGQSGFPQRTARATGEDWRGTAQKLLAMNPNATASRLYLSWFYLASARSWLYLHGGGIGRGDDRGLVHRLNRGGTDAELARIDDLEQVNIFLVAAEIGLEKGGMVIVKFAAGKPVAPPGRLLFQLVQRILLDEFGPGRNRVFNQEILPVAAIHAQMYGNHVSGVDIALKRLQIINNFFFFLLRGQAIVIAGDVQGELVALEELLFRGVVLAAR